MSSLGVVTLIFTVSSYVIIFGEGQDVFFGLKRKRELSHQVLNINETNVIVTCNVSCITAASIQIKSVSSTESRSEIGNSIDYLIPVVSEDLHFTCVVTYNISSSEISKEAYWLPHIIKEPGDPYCYRNGTISQPYNIGDILLLGCVCDMEQLCKWIAVITADSEKVQETNLNFTSTPLNETRILLQTVVGPIEPLPADHLKTYICISNVSYPNSQICVIQPLNASTLDNVVTSTPTQSPKCNLSENFDVKVAAPTVPSSQSNDFLFVTIGIASLLVILILVLVVVVVCVGIKVRNRLVDNRRDMRNEPCTSDASEFHLYDRPPNEGYPHSIPSVHDSSSFSSKRDKACVERTVDNKCDRAAYPYYYPFEIECPERPDYSNVNQYYVNGAQV